MRMAEAIFPTFIDGRTTCNLMTYTYWHRKKRKTFHSRRVWLGTARHCNTIPIGQNIFPRVTQKCEKKRGGLGGARAAAPAAICQTLSTRNDLLLLLYLSVCLWPPSYHSVRSTFPSERQTDRDRERERAKYTGGRPVKLITGGPKPAVSDWERERDNKRFLPFHVHVLFFVHT